MLLQEKNGRRLPPPYFTQTIHKEIKIPVKTYCLRFSLCLIITYLCCAALNPALAAPPSLGENGTYFCGVYDLQSASSQFSDRRYARTLANLDVGEPRTVRLIYFLANDRPAQKDINTILDGADKTHPEIL